MGEAVQSLTDAEVSRRLEWRPLIDALEAAFQEGGDSPPRPHYDIQVPGEENGALLLMPAWREGRHIGLKTVTVFPGNAERMKPSVNAQYLLFSATSGALVAILEAGALTARRTAAASALASSYLSQPNSKRLLIVGTGRLSPNLAAAHAAVRDFDDVAIWGRDISKAQKIAAELVAAGLPARAGQNLEAEARGADVISCCTLSREPLVRGEWLKAGAHLDLVGAFTPEMRETDDAALIRSSVFVDTFEGALSESGELVQALASGAITRRDIQASLFELSRGEHQGRGAGDEITLFKSVGCSLEDLAAAELCIASPSSPTNDAPTAS